jgi:hypothetical protein
MAAFDWIINKLKRDKLKALNAAALKAQGMEGSKLTAKEKQIITRNYFVSSGIDHKGQSQCCFEARGLSAEAEVEVDPALLASGVFSAHITLGASGSVTTKKLIIAQVGPKSIGNYEVPFPFLLNTCSGRSWSGGVSADIFIGVGVTAGISFDMEVAGKDFSSSAKAEAKAGATVNAAVSAAHYYAEDYAPIVNGDRTQALADLAALLTAGGNKKDYYKDKATEIIGNVKRRNPISRFIATTTGVRSEYKPTDEIIAQLDTAIQSSATSPEQKDEARIIITELKYIQDKKKPVISSCIRITNYSAEGGVEMTANAGANANACGLVGASIEVSAKACANGSYKPVTVRSQAVYPAFDRTDTARKTRFVVMTQDTRILYEKYDLEVSATASASITCESTKKNTGSSEDSKPPFERERTKDFVKYNLNRMTYITTVVYWQSLVPWPSGFNPVTRSLVGSGISFGGSYQLEDLAIYSKTILPVLEALQPLFILNTTEDNVGETEAVPTESKADYEAESIFNPATLVSATVFDGTLESARGYDSSGDEGEKFNIHADSKFTGSKENSAMPSRIGQALADYERQIKAFFSSQSAGSKRAHNILKKMVSENNPKLGDTVAWLIGEDKGDAEIDTLQFNNERLRQVGGAKGFFSQKSKGDKEGRLYGLLKARYSEAIMLDQKAADFFSQEENHFKSNAALLSQQLQEENKGVRDRNKESRGTFEAQERVRVEKANQEIKNQYNAQEAARVEAENKIIRDRFATELEEIQARNKQKKDEFLKKQEEIVDKNNRKIVMKKRIEAINAQIERANTTLQVENNNYKEINKTNQFADDAPEQALAFALNRIKYDRHSTEKVNFDELETKNEKIINANRERMARNQIKQTKWGAQNQYFTLLAANLHVSVQDLQTFFASRDMINWMEFVEDLMAMGKTVLLESTFRENNHDITLVSSVKDSRQVLIELMPNTAENMLNCFKQGFPEARSRKLESIRMRWRIQDMADSSSNLFKLGISVFNQGGKIQLKNIDEAGSEGIVDLCTVFFNDFRDVPEDATDYQPGRAARLERAVPPTVLYCL